MLLLVDSHGRLHVSTLQIDSVLRASVELLQVRSDLHVEPCREVLEEDGAEPEDALHLP